MDTPGMCVCVCVCVCVLWIDCWVVPLAIQCSSGPGSGVAPAQPGLPSHSHPVVSPALAMPHTVAARLVRELAALR
eukprot:COSAG01_NODE_4672_length_4829_cov_3.623890_2_plen_76_part_00